MTKIFWVALACWAAIVNAAAADVRQEVVEPYLRVQKLLADDAIAGIKTEAGRIAAGARALGPSGAPAEQAALALQAATSLEAARDAFGRLSDALIALADAGGLGPSGLTIAYCPMDKKSWLQRGTAIVNPYYGRAMLTCGNVVRTVK